MIEFFAASLGGIWLLIAVVSMTSRRGNTTPNEGQEP